MKWVFIQVIFCFGICRGFGQGVIEVRFGSTGSPVIISRHIYGQFAEHLGRSMYDGFYRKGEGEKAKDERKRGGERTVVGGDLDGGRIRMDIVQALRRIRVPNLRWPGGCFADQYHWRDGTGPVAQRRHTINTAWGMVEEDNSFGTEEFMELCRLIGCEPYIAGNVGTGSPQEMKDWVEWLNVPGSRLQGARFELEDSGCRIKDTGARLQVGRDKKQGEEKKRLKVSLWGVGNESWGCGGNMTPEYYADLYKHYASFLPDYPGAPLKKIIGGANGDDYHWTEVMMKNIPVDQAYGLSLHYYTFPTGKWNPRGSATSFSESEYAHTLVEAQRIDSILRGHEAIMDKYDPEKKIALLVDEWGVWTDVEPGTPRHGMYQQNSLRDGLIAAYTLNVFNNHASRVRGANLAQTVNVIHSLILTRGDSMLLTPTYHVFDLFKVHEDAVLMPVRYISPVYICGVDTVRSLSVSASQDSGGVVHVSLVNLDPARDVAVRIDAGGLGVGSRAKTVEGKLLTSDRVTDVNEFNRPPAVYTRVFRGFQWESGGLMVAMPAKSVVVLELK